MTILQIEVEDAHPVAVACDSEHLSVTLRDGRVRGAFVVVPAVAKGL